MAPEQQAVEQQAAVKSWYELVASRRSIRRYQADPLPEAAIRRVLQAACWAPSAHNRQPWRFAVVKGAELKDRLARAMGERLRADRRADGDPAEFIDKDVARSYARLTGAPIVIVVALDMADMDRYPDEKRRNAEFVMAVQSTAMATQNLLLAAHAEGVGSCWMCAPLFCPAAVVAALAMPAGWQPQAIVTLGKPDGEGKPATRRALDDVLWMADDDRSRAALLSGAGESGERDP